jgi:hypothetical protein
VPDYIRKFNIIVSIGVLACIAFVLAVPRAIEPCRMSQMDDSESFIRADSLQGVKEAVILDARQEADNTYGKGTESADDYFFQLLGIYECCLDIDTLIIFNAGGFGWDTVADAQGWITVMRGIESFIQDSGEKTFVVDFERTRRSIDGVISEAASFFGLYPAKSIDLAGRISFLTRNLPELKVLITGESNGAALVEETFRLLQDNPRVAAFQTGPTVFQKSIEHERSLVLRHNGEIPDSFSQGDIFTILRSNLEAALGINQEHPGDILFYIGAPGHYYTWEYPEFRIIVTEFLSVHLS